MVETPVFDYGGTAMTPSSMEGSEMARSPRLRRALATVIASALLGCSDAPVPAPAVNGAPAPAPAHWHVEGGFLRDASGRAALLRGFNVSGKHKTPPYFDFQGPQDYARIRTDWGMNAVRFLVLWAAIEPEPGVYDEDYLAEVERRLRWAGDAGLEVVIDMHQDIFGEGFAHAGGDGAPVWACDQAHYDQFVPPPPGEPWFLSYLDDSVIACYDGFWQRTDLREHFVGAWRKLAARLRDVPSVVGFEPLNEPFWGSYDIFSFEQDVLRPFYLEVIAAVRGEAPEWVAFVEPSSSRNIGFATALEPLGVPHVVYAPHSYDRDAESGDGFDPSRREAVMSNMVKLADEAKALGAALWIGEYGGTADHPGIAEYMDAEVDATTSVLAGSAYWSYDKGGGYGFLDADGNEKPELAAALIRPGPDRVGGVPLAWSWDAENRELLFEMESNVGDPLTIIQVPPRIYPEGTALECSGCAASAIADGELTVETTTSGVVRVVLAPAQ